MENIDKEKYCLKAREFFKRANQKFVVGLFLAGFAVASVLAGGALLFYKSYTDKQVDAVVEEYSQSEEAQISARDGFDLQATDNDRNDKDFNYDLAALALFTVAGVAGVGGKICEKLGDSDQMRGYQAQNEEENW